MRSVFSDCDFVEFCWYLGRQVLEQEKTLVAQSMSLKDACRFLCLRSNCDWLVNQVKMLTLTHLQTLFSNHRSSSQDFSFQLIKILLFFSKIYSISTPRWSNLTTFTLLMSPNKYSKHSFAVHVILLIQSIIQTPQTQSIFLGAETNTKTKHETGVMIN